jgi:hypothetical protein
MAFLLRVPRLLRRLLLYLRKNATPPTTRLRERSDSLKCSVRARQQNAFVHVLNVGVSAKRHGDVQFFVDDLQRLGDTNLAHGAQAVHKSAANHGAPCARGPGLEHVLAAAYATVHPHFYV